MQNYGFTPSSSYETPALLEEPVQPPPVPQQQQLQQKLSLTQVRHVTHDAASCLSPLPFASVALHGDAPPPRTALPPTPTRPLRR